MLASDHIYRAQTVGSLLRPPQLKQARQDLQAGRISPLEFKRIEDGAVDAALALQERAGLDIVSDGEMRRAHFTGPLSEVVAGMEAVRAPVQRWHGGGDGEPTYAHTRAVTGKLRRLRSLACEEFVYLRARTRRPIKATLPSPLMMQTFWSPEHSPAAYSDPFEMFADAAEILREEARELVSLGCQFIQIDAPDIGFLVDESVRAALRERGIDPRRMLGEGIEIIDSVADVAGAQFGIHLCKGNREGHWLAAGGYGAISREVFPRLAHFDVLLLEYDDERSGGFEPLADVPSDKYVVLGLISTKRAEVESPDAVLARIDQAGEHFARERLAVSPQCGFASVMAGNPIAPEVQERKLHVVAEVARAAWP
jgi:5-methyltetrahydropteroyltriglutamate--homocysteine methyltransferase